MSLFYTATDKDLFRARNRIVKEVAIPTLFEQGFAQCPFSSSFGAYPGNRRYYYWLCRLKAPDMLQLVHISVHHGNRWIQIHVNVVRLDPAPSTLEQLKTSDFRHFGMPPISWNEMRVRGVPKPFAREHRVGSYWTRRGYDRQVGRLSELIARDMRGINAFFDQWHAWHKPPQVQWSAEWKESLPAPADR